MKRHPPLNPRVYAKMVFASLKSRRIKAIENNLQSDLQALKYRHILPHRHPINSAIYSHYYTIAIAQMLSKNEGKNCNIKLFCVEVIHESPDTAKLVLN